ncbi:MAG: phosphate starvation-inducible protein PhoH [Rhodobiaceae bacterium]|nr:phosphate starvation-inducible protein PhoH [Rhodobiaceae bacterium]|tara:strand:+ start:42343 stop:43344 length:1002 start_codon:yes stop_codon:yes gene_type:complete
MEVSLKTDKNIKGLTIEKISDSCLHIAIDDSEKLVNIFGRNDENLKLIENKIKVEIIPHGNKIQIKGTMGKINKTKDIIVDMLDRYEMGIDNNLDEVSGLIRIKNSSLSSKEGRKKKTIIKTKIKTILPRSVSQDNYINSIYSNPLTFGIGPAGTGKTYIAVAAASYFLEAGLVDRIILSRPAVEAGEKLGFLPGDLKEKIDPYLRPLYDALYDCLPSNKVQKGLDNNIIEIAPLAFMRGRTLENAFVILDEAQNCNSIQMKMFLTRLGVNSKMVITGDPTQIDLPNNTPSGLLEAIQITKNIKEVTQINFTADDVVRHTLVAKIINAYNETK